MELLVETYSAQEANLITEAVDDGKNIYLTGTVMQAEVPNKNKRRYQLAEMTEQVQNAMMHIREHGGIFGEADHPQGLNINFDRISHVITEMNMHGNNVSGKLRLLDTPMGLIAKTLSKSGVRYGVSSRGTGTVRPDGIVENFTFVTLDLVIQPSANAYPSTVYESMQTKLGQQTLTLAESLQQDPAAQKYFKKKFDQFIKELMNK